MFYINNDKLVFITLLPEIEVIFPPYYTHGYNMIFDTKTTFMIYSLCRILLPLKI